MDTMNNSQQKFGDILHKDVVPDSVLFKIPAGFDPGLLDPSRATNFFSDDLKALLGIPVAHKPHMALGKFFSVASVIAVARVACLHPIYSESCR
jgi:hypothetical protein